MRLRFSPQGDDEDAYRASRETLLDEFGRWLDRPEPELDEVVADAGMFLDWRAYYSSGVLDEFSGDDLAEFLLRWCPRKLSAPGDLAAGVCAAVGAFVDFMADTGRLVGGADRAATLRTLAGELAPTMREEMDNPANFGMAKTLVGGLGDLSSLSEDELRAALQTRMDEHNALPFAERKAITDGVITAEPQPYELPFRYIPPPAADVESAAAAAPLMGKVAALHEYLGPTGKALTTKGNLKLADGRALIELLDTGDVMDRQIGDRTWKTVSTADLPQLSFLLDVAKQAGAVRVHQRRLVPVKAWGPRTPVQRAAALFAAILQLGPLCSRVYYRSGLFDQVDELLDDGIVHWMVLALGDQVELPVDTVVELAQTAVAQQIAPYWPDWSADQLEPFVRRDISRIFAVLETAGVLVWSDKTQESTTYDSYPVGGVVRLTALGRHILPDYLAEAGYALGSGDDLTDADGTALIDAFVEAPATGHESVLRSWQPERPTVERIQLLTAAIIKAPNAKRRVMGFHALDLFDIDVAEPLVRQLLDTAVAGHAALWLIARDRADIATLGSFVDSLVKIDVLAGDLDDPEELCRRFLGSPDPLAMLDDMWRQPTPETALVLDALGRHLSDPKLAKAARKAAMRHRSWMANRS